MQRVSVRTLVLLVELLVAVLAQQCLAQSAPPRAEVLWLATEFNSADDPNGTGDPNGTDDPPPEFAWTAPFEAVGFCADDDPNGTDDPPPEFAWTASLEIVGFCADDDPNDTDDPPPETA